MQILLDPVDGMIHDGGKGYFSWVWKMNSNSLCLKIGKVVLFIHLFVMGKIILGTESKVHGQRYKRKYGVSWKLQYNTWLEYKVSGEGLESEFGIWRRRALSISHCPWDGGAVLYPSGYSRQSFWGGKTWLFPCTLETYSSGLEGKETRTGD